MQWDGLGWVEDPFPEREGVPQPTGEGKEGREGICEDKSINCADSWE